MIPSDKRMRVVRLERFGPPSFLAVADAPRPIPTAGEVVVEVAYASVTFVETQLRAGRGPFPVELPLVLGNGVAGTVSQAGSGIDPRLLGRRVVTTTGGSGGYAEMAAVSTAGLIEVPEAVELDKAAALLADGRTALSLTETAALAPGDRVLVEAAAGGVGSLLVQLAIDSGATVIGVAGGDQKLAAVRRMGAHFAFDYRKNDWPDLVRDAIGGVDVVFDGVGGSVGRTAFELLESGGRMVTFGLASGRWADVSEAEASGRGATLVPMRRLTSAESKALTEKALDLADAGRLRPHVGQLYPLEGAADAHAAIEARATIGKTLLVP